MNERIKELIEKSYDIVPHERDWDATSSVFNKEKFAELILKECLKYTDDSFGDIDYVKFMIKRNFGVGE